MDWMNETSVHDSADVSFRRAKIEHYLTRAEECLTMCRFNAATQVLNKALQLEPKNKAGLELKKNIEYARQSLLAVARGQSNGHVSTRRREIILVVDQDERVLSSLSRQLMRYGFKAIGAANFQEALEMLAEFHPHLIISEINFENGPVGFDLYFWVRNNAALHRTPFIFLATRLTREMLIAGKRLGVDEFVQKPLDEEVLMATVLNCLARKRKVTT